MQHEDIIQGLSKNASGATIEPHCMNVITHQHLLAGKLMRCHSTLR